MVIFLTFYVEIDRQCRYFVDRSAPLHSVVGNIIYDVNCRVLSISLIIRIV